ncbi:MAG TPA: KH domain-containing protein [Actinomycetota bacterium]|nr:KH domain-containing protein [Actinomycetota bacterium]
MAAEEDGDDPGADDEGSVLADVLEYIAREIVDDPDAVEVTETPDSRGVVLTLRVAKDDMGRVIGKGGRTARAIRTVVKAAAIRAGIRHTHVEIAD